MTVFQPCLQRQTYKGKNEMGGTYFMEKTEATHKIYATAAVFIFLDSFNI